MKQRLRMAVKRFVFTFMDCVVVIRVKPGRVASFPFFEGTVVSSTAVKIGSGFRASVSGKKRVRTTKSTTPYMT
jgi:hypothetical protein